MTRATIAVQRRVKFCDCIRQTDQALERAYPGRGITVNHSLPLRIDDEPRVVISLDIIAKRGSKPTLFASYCPFCGRKYDI